MTKNEDLKACVCPFCKKAPIFGRAKKTSCQMHGEPMQDSLLSCENRDCPAKPSVRGGDIYNGGEHKARLEAVKKWNVCAETRPTVTPTDTVTVSREVLQGVREALDRIQNCHAENWRTGVMIATKALASLDAVLSEGE